VLPGRKEGSFLQALKIIEEADGLAMEVNKMAVRQGNGGGQWLDEANSGYKSLMHG